MRFVTVSTEFIGLFSAKLNTKNAQVLAKNTNDVDNNYKVTYVIDYDTISDTDLATFNFSRDLETMRNNYVSQGFTCK